MSTLAQLRTKLAKRVGYWYGASDATGSAATLTSGNTTTQLFDTTRQEPDDQFDGAWLAYKPGTTSIVWRQLASDRGYIQANGSFNLVVAMGSTPNAGDQYELYTGGIAPNVWTDALNWALQNAYPNRHSRIVFEVQEDPDTRYYDYHDLAAHNSITDPTTAPTLTHTGSTSSLKAGTYQVGYALKNTRGTTKVSTTSSVTIVDGEIINVAEITGIDANTIAIDWYMSNEPGSTVLAKLTVGQVTLQSSAPTGSVFSKPVQDQSGLASPPVYIFAPPPTSAQMAPSVNTTAQEIIDFYNIARIANAGSGPEMLAENTADGWERLGGTMIQVNFRPVQNYYMRFIGLGYVPTLSSETDTTNEPEELILAGAEHYIWWLLTKSSTLQATNWSVLAKDALGRFEQQKAKNTMLKPIKYVSAPPISAGFGDYT